jgi:hypothetical protein
VVFCKVATNGTIDANKARTEGTKSFYDIFMIAAKKQRLDYNKLNPRKTYMFELVSPWNRLVIPYNYVKIYHIGTRDLDSLLEEEVDLGIEKPMLFDLSSLEDTLVAVSKLKGKDGFVVVDSSDNRVKIKSPTYLLMHHLRGNGDAPVPTTISKFISVLQKGEDTEILATFPEWAAVFTSLREEISRLIHDAVNYYKDYLTSLSEGPRKEFAIVALKHTLSSLFFRLLDSKDEDIEGCLTKLIWETKPDFLVSRIDQAKIVLPFLSEVEE